MHPGGGDRLGSGRPSHAGHNRVDCGNARSRQPSGSSLSTTMRSSAAASVACSRPSPAGRWRPRPATSTDALRAVLGHKPDILVLDLNLAGVSSLEYIPELLERSPATRIVVLTMQTEPAYARDALRAGASAYVLKESAEDELVTAVKAAADGKTYLNPRVGAMIAAEPVGTRDGRRADPPRGGDPAPAGARTHER